MTFTATTLAFRRLPSSLHLQLRSKVFHQMFVPSNGQGWPIPPITIWTFASIVLVAHLLGSRPALWEPLHSKNSPRPRPRHRPGKCRVRNTHSRTRDNLDLHLLPVLRTIWSVCSKRLQLSFFAASVKKRKKAASSRGTPKKHRRTRALAIPIPRRRVARAEAIWAFVGVVVIWAGFVVLAEVKFPWWYDREYEVRHELLDERVAGASGAAALGRDRQLTALAPLFARASCRRSTMRKADRCCRSTTRITAPAPRLNLMQMHRLIPGRRARSPQWLAIEIVPAHLRYEAISSTLASAADLPELMPYENKPKLLMEFSRLRLNVIYKNRTSFLRTFAPPFATKAGGEGDDIFLGLPRRRRDPQAEEPGAHPENKKQQQYELIKGMYANQMKQFDFDPQLIAATRGLLELCRERHIPETMLLIAPGKTAASARGLATAWKKKIQQLYRGLGDEFGISRDRCTRVVPR